MRIAGKSMSPLNFSENNGERIEAKSVPWNNTQLFFKFCLRQKQRMFTSEVCLFPFFSSEEFLTYLL